MRRSIAILAVVGMGVTLLGNLSFAGLINYDRLQSRGGGGGAADSGPLWMRQAPVATSLEEKKYDANRDGILQTAEIKIFLRDVVDTVEAKGSFTINSDILKEYDQNRDGVITRFEVSDIRTHAGN